MRGCRPRWRSAATAWWCCASPAASRSPSASASCSRTRRWTIDPRAEALLYAAARAQLVATELRPLLDSGTTVLLDRFVDSSLAYQGAGRGLGVEEIRALNAFGTGGLTPDRTLLLRIDPATGLGGSPAGPRTGSSRRTWRSSPRSRRVRQLAAADPERIAVIDAAQAPEAVLADALAALLANVNRGGGAGIAGGL